MRNYLKRTGISAVIVFALALCTFAPRKFSQGVLVAGLALIGIFAIVSFFVKNKEMFKKSLAEKEFKSNKSETDISSDSALSLKHTIIQLAHRITDKLHSIYPESTWDWVDKPTAKAFSEGGKMRISVMNAGDYDEADIILDSFGRIDVKFLKTASISELIKETSEKASTEYTTDAKMWYEQRGKQALTVIISELNAQGTKSLAIDEDGNVTLENSKKVDTIEAFPTKNLWKQLIDIFQADQLKAAETENSIILSW